MTSLFSTVAVCTTWLVSTVNSSDLNFDFSYKLPNMTLLAEISGEKEPFADIYDACTSPDNYTVYDRPVSTDTHRRYGVATLYYWNNEALNSSWWSHFQSDPFTSEYYDWASWGFYPTSPANFRCVTASGTYQVPKASFLNYPRFTSNKTTVGLLS
jgi:hypothetical protein